MANNDFMVQVGIDVTPVTKGLDSIESKAKAVAGGQGIRDLQAALKGLADAVKGTGASSGSGQSRHLVAYTARAATLRKRVDDLDTDVNAATVSIRTGLDNAAKNLTAFRNALRKFANTSSTKIDGLAQELQAVWAKIQAAKAALKNMPNGPSGGTPPAAPGATPSSPSSSSSDKSVLLQRAREDSVRRAVITSGMIDPKQSAVLQTDQLSKWRTVSAAVAKNMLGVDEGLSRIVPKVLTWMSATTLVYGTMRGIHSLMTEISKLDVGKAGIARLYRANDMTSEQAATQLTAQAARMAGTYGVPISDVQSQMKDYARQGKNVYEITKLMTASLLLQKAADMDAATAARTTTAVMKQYGLTVDETITYVDKLNSLENTTAARAKDVAEAVARTGTAAKAAGVDLTQLMAISAQQIETTGRRGTEIGRGLRTMFTRMQTERAQKVLREEAKTGPGDKGIEASLVGGGILGGWDILTKIADKWANLNQQQQAHIALAVAGKDRINEFRGSMENWGKVLSNITSQQMSANSAAIEAARLQDTVTGKLEQLKQKWTGLLVAPGMSGGLSNSIKDSLDALKSSVDWLQGVNTEHIKKVVAGITALFMAIKAFQTLGGLAAGLTAMGLGGAVTAGALAPLAAITAAVLGFVGVMRVLNRERTGKFDEIAKGLQRMSTAQAAAENLAGGATGFAKQLEFSRREMEGIAKSTKSAADKEQARQRVIGNLKPTLDQLKLVEDQLGLASSKRLTTQIDLEKLSHGTITDSIRLLGGESDAVKQLIVDFNNLAKSKRMESLSTATQAQADARREYDAATAGFRAAAEARARAEGYSPNPMMQAKEGTDAFEDRVKTIMRGSVSQARNALHTGIGKRGQLRQDMATQAAAERVDRAQEALDKAKQLVNQATFVPFRPSTESIDTRGEAPPSAGGKGAGSMPAIKSVPLPPEFQGEEGRIFPLDVSLKELPEEARRGFAGWVASLMSQRVSQQHALAMQALQDAQVANVGGRRRTPLGPDGNTLGGNYLSLLQAYEQARAAAGKAKGEAGREIADISEQGPVSFSKEGIAAAKGKQRVEIDAVSRDANDATRELWDLYKRVEDAAALLPPGMRKAIDRARAAVLAVRGPIEKYVGFTMEEGGVRQLFEAKGSPEAQRQAVQTVMDTIRLRKEMEDLVGGFSLFGSGISAESVAQARSFLSDLEHKTGVLKASEAQAGADKFGGGSHVNAYQLLAESIREQVDIAALAVDASKLRSDTFELIAQQARAGIFSAGGTVSPAQYDALIDRGRADIEGTYNIGNASVGIDQSPLGMLALLAKATADDTKRAILVAQRRVGFSGGAVSTAQRLMGQARAAGASDSVMDAWRKHVDEPNKAYIEELGSYRELLLKVQDEGLSELTRQFDERSKLLDEAGRLIVAQNYEAEVRRLQGLSASPERFAEVLKRAVEAVKDAREAISVLDTKDMIESWDRAIEQMKTSHAAAMATAASAPFLDEVGKFKNQLLALQQQDEQISLQFDALSDMRNRLAAMRADALSEYVNDPESIKALSDAIAKGEKALESLNVDRVKQARDKDNALAMAKAGSDAFAAFGVGNLRSDRLKRLPSEGLAILSALEDAQRKLSDIPMSGLSRAQMEAGRSGESLYNAFDQWARTNEGIESTGKSGVELQAVVDKYKGIRAKVQASLAELFAKQVQSFGDTLVKSLDEQVKSGRISNDDLAAQIADMALPQDQQQRRAINRSTQAEIRRINDQAFKDGMLGLEQYDVLRAQAVEKGNQELLRLEQQRFIDLKALYSNALADILGDVRNWQQVVNNLGKRFLREGMEKGVQRYFGGALTAFSTGKPGNPDETRDMMGMPDLVDVSQKRAELGATGKYQAFLQGGSGEGTGLAASKLNKRWGAGSPEMMAAQGYLKDAMMLYSIGAQAAEGGSAFGGLLQGGISGFMAGGPIGGLLGGLSGLFGGLFGKKKAPAPPPPPQHLPTAQDLQWSSPVGMPSTMYLGGRYGGGGRGVSNVTINGMNLSFPSVTDATTAQAAGRAFTAGMTENSRALSLDASRGSQGRL